MAKTNHFSKIFVYKGFPLQPEKLLLIHWFHILLIEKATTVKKRSVYLTICLQLLITSKVTYWLSREKFVKGLSVDGDALSIIVCEDFFASISCPIGHTISIQSAAFGR